MMTLVQSVGGSPSISPRSILTNGWASSSPVTCFGEAVAVDGERAAGGQFVGIPRRHDQRARQAHFGVQKPTALV